MNWIYLGAQEWRDVLFLKYVLEPPDLPNYCDGCNSKFTIDHTINYKRGGFVTAHHNKLQEGVADLAGKAFNPSNVRDDPLIFAGCAVKRPKANRDRTIGLTDWDSVPPQEATEQKGDLLIRDLWQNGTNSVHDMHVVNTYAKTHSGKTPERCLQEAEREKKRMYLEACLQQRRHFPYFVASVDGLLGVEATATLKMIASRLTKKWRQPYSRMCSYVNSRIDITLVQATHRCIRGYRVTAHWISVQRPQWEDIARLNLFR